MLEGAIFGVLVYIAVMLAYCAQTLSEIKTLLGTSDENADAAPSPAGLAKEI